MEENIQQNTEPGLFDSYQEYTDASSWSRFFNFLIDQLFMRYALGWLTGYLLAQILAVVAPEFLFRLVYEGTDNGDLLIYALILTYINFLLYYTICEVAFKGYTLGKLITGTRAIREDGNPLTFKDAILRTLSRMVPFEPFSAFGGRPWHDTWTKTRVVQAR